MPASCSISGNKFYEPIGIRVQVQYERYAGKKKYIMKNTKNSSKISKGAKLLFIYNADNNLVALITGTAHKVVSPKTYGCNLCRLTYPLAKMDENWKKFIESLPYPVVFLHRDEFSRLYSDKKDAKLPAVFTEDASGVRLLIGANKINEAKNLPDLIEVVRNSLPEGKNNKNFYQCPECGLNYADERTAKECEAWCKEHKSCNIDIIKHAVKK